MNESDADAVSASSAPARPGFWRRLGCSAADGAIVLVLAILASVYLLGFTPPESDAPGDPVPANTEFVAMAVVGFLYCFAFVAVLGWTPGKRLGRCRVAGPGGVKPGVGRALVRALLFPGLLALVELPRAMAPDGNYTWLSDIGAVYLLATCVLLLADRKWNRAVHDFVAGTRVVYEPKVLPDPYRTADPDPTPSAA